MNRKKIYLILGIAAVVAMSGCSTSKKDVQTEAAAEKSADKTAEISLETEDDSEFIYLDESWEEETEAVLDPFNSSDYLIENVDEYVKLPEVKGLSATEYTYTVTDEAVDEQIASEMEYGAEEQDVDRPAQDGDTLYVELVSTISGEETSSQEDTYFVIGTEDYGEEFDKELVGLSAGDTKSFEISFDDEIWMDEWVDKTVKFDVTVSSVCETIIPDLTDDYVKENTDYTSVDEYKKAMRQKIEDEYTESSRYEVFESLFAEVEESAVFTGYPQELFDSMKEELISFYSIFTESGELSDLLDTFGITEEEFDEEVLSSVNHRLIISAICKNNNLDVTEQEYKDYLQEYTDYYGYTNIVEFENENDRSTLVWNLFEQKAGEFLYDNASITKEDYVEDDDSALEELSEEEIQALYESLGGVEVVTDEMMTE